MTEKQVTLGQAIDQIIEALRPLKPEERLTAVEAACSHLDVKIESGRPVLPTPSASLSQQPPSSQSTSPGPIVSPRLKVDIRSLKDQKQPKSARQMACVIAYYLRELAPESERRETVNSKELEKYFKQARFKLPKNIGQILPDARSGGYFETASGKGEYALNAVGYNLVAHNLPTNKGE